MSRVTPMTPMTLPSASSRGVFSLLALGDLAPEADEADDFSAVVAQRNLGRQHDDLAAAGIEDAFLLVDNRLAGKDALFVGEKFRRDLRREKIGIAPPNER